MENPIISLILIYSNNKESIKTCIESLLNQEMKNFELLCINTGSTDESDEIVSEFAKNDERVKFLNICENSAKKSAVMLSSGDYVCFVDVNKLYKEDFISNLYQEAVYAKEQKLQIKTDMLYNRYFIENSAQTDLMINKHITQQANELSTTVKNYKDIIFKELEQYKKAQIETINNKTYDITVRFDRLEKNYYQNTNEINNLIKRVMKKCNITEDEEETQYTPLYNEILKLRYELTSEINNKGCEINKVYEEITNNYKYTENLLSKTKEDIESIVKYDNFTLKEKFGNFVNETELRYDAVKNYVNSRLNEMDSKLTALMSSGGSDTIERAECIDTEKIMKQNAENIYSSMNKFNADFYAELSKMYKELNEKLITVCKNQEIQIDAKLKDVKSQLNAEFDMKLQRLKEEMAKQV